MSAIPDRIKLLANSGNVPIVYLPEDDVDLLFMEDNFDGVWSCYGEKYEVETGWILADKPNFNTPSGIAKMGISEKDFFVNFKKIVKRRRVEDLHTLLACITKLMSVAIKFNHGIKYVNVFVNVRKINA